MRNTKLDGEDISYKNTLFEVLYRIVVLICKVALYSLIFGFFWNNLAPLIGTAPLTFLQSFSIIGLLIMLKLFVVEG